jgi:ribosomal protein S18 acetylase RimI-like enzyme
MTQSVRLAPVEDSEELEFLTMAEAYFRELDSRFVPHEDWNTSYFKRLQSAAGVCLRWIQCGADRVGFVIYGVERHRFLPRMSGWVYELYILPHRRRSGVGKQAAVEVLRVLRQLAPSKIQLEVTPGNTSARLFWQALGFDKVAERYVLGEVPK